MTKLPVILSYLVALAIMGTTMLSAQEPEQAKDDQAISLLEESTDFYNQQQAFTFKSNTSFELDAAGRKQTASVQHEITVERPNKVLSEITEGQMGAVIASDGEELITHLLPMSMYTTQQAPSDFESLLEESAIERLVNTPNGDSLSLLFVRPDFAEHLLDDAQTAQYVGLAGEQESKTHHLTLDKEAGVWDIWIADGDQPFVQKISVDLSKNIAEIDPDGKYIVETIYSNWTAAESIAPDQFAYTPPASAQKVDDLFRQRQQARPSDRLLGKPAPAAEFELLDGGSASLAQHKGKDVVVLDFWATWCPPCIRGLPIVTRVTEKYADQNVVFYAVDQGEDTATINAFFNGKDYKPTVALDKDASIGNLFMITAIPQTVLIDKEGIIQAIHTGYGPNSEERLENELQKLIAGESLLAK